MDRPILFSAPMVRALLEGRKTQTRRIAKFIEPIDDGEFHIHNAGGGLYGVSEADVPADAVDFAPIAAGDRLWVRESGQLLREAYDHDPRAGEDLWRDAGYCHSADGEIIEARSYDPPLREWVDDCSRISRPSIHMPRWASRLTLTVADVRVQRLQDISEEDARAEGALIEYGEGASISERRAFNLIWEHVNGTGSWEQNPWVAAYTFTVERRNIDASTREESRHG